MTLRTPLTVALAATAAALVLRQTLRHRRRMDFRNASVLITGGSRGLGLELARAFAREGARLTILGRDQRTLAAAAAELTHICEAPVLAQTCDVRDREQVRHAVRRTIARFGRIDVLVNNAGVIQFGPAEHMQLADYRDSLDTHFYGPLYTTLETLPHMKRQGGGRIVNITSIGGLVTFPHAIPYSVGKHAHVGLSDGLRAELARHNIRVCTIVPGLMRTGSHVNAFFKGQHEAEYAWFTLGAANPAISTSSRHAAKRIVNATRFGDPHLTLTLAAKLLKTANTVTPRLLARWMQFGNWLLPNPATDRTGDTPRLGRDSRTPLTRSPLTHPADAVVAPNNEQ
ncbi:MAG: SDR family oxidoreductase [Phycisphaeraceae bacterium]